MLNAPTKFRALVPSISVRTSYAYTAERTDSIISNPAMQYCKFHRTRHHVAILRHFRPRRQRRISLHLGHYRASSTGQIKIRIVLVQKHPVPPDCQGGHRGYNVPHHRLEEFSGRSNLPPQSSSSARHSRIVPTAEIKTGSPHARLATASSAA